MQIQMRAGDLRRGDVMTGSRGGQEVVVLSVTRDDMVWVTGWTAEDSTHRFTFLPDDGVTVEVRDVRATDAEIDALVEATRDYLEAVPEPLDIRAAPRSPAMKLPAARREKLAKLVDRLAPVQAPTLAEALDALRVLLNDGPFGANLNAATRLLERARRAGVMP